MDKQHKTLKRYITTLIIQDLMKRIGIRIIVKQDKSKVGDNTKIRTKRYAFEI